MTTNLKSSLFNKCIKEVRLYWKIFLSCRVFYSEINVNENMYLAVLGELLDRMTMDIVCLWKFICLKLSNITSFCSGPGSSFGIATDYGLDSPGSNPGGDEVFRPSRPALGPTQPPVKWVPSLFSGGKVRPGRAANHSPPSSTAVIEE